MDAYVNNILYNLSREREVVLSFHETFHMVDELLEIVDDLIKQESKS